jgi:hypothetical protein
MRTIPVFNPKQKNHFADINKFNDLLLPLIPPMIPQGSLQLSIQLRQATA